MAHIGTFTKTGNNELTGGIATLSLNVTNVRIIPQDQRGHDNAPSHRIVKGQAEIGAAWQKTSNEGRPYLAVKLDDPSFKAPIYANLFDDENDRFNLVWSRSSNRR